MESTHQQPAFWEQRAADARARAAEWRKIRALLIRFGVDRADADDVAQEVAIGVHRTTSILERADLVWLTARSKAHDYRRSQLLERLAFADAEPQIQTLTAPTNGEAEMMERAPLALLLRAVDTLEPSLHEVVRLHLEGRTLPEIAAAQGTPYGTAVSRTHRARAVLRETLHRWTAEDEGRALRAALRGAERWN